MIKDIYKENISYYTLHAWIRNKYGNADRCESLICEGKSNNYQYALLKGKEHELKRENYWMLCASCHRKYDMTDELRKKMSEANKGKHHSPATEFKKGGPAPKAAFKKGNIPWNKGKKLHYQVWNKGKTGVYSEETLKRMSETNKRNPVNYWLGKHRSEETKRKMSESMKGQIPWNKGLKLANL